MRAAGRVLTWRTVGTRALVQGISLTKREEQVLQLIGQGFTIKRVAASLHITVATARKHRENLMRKLDAHSTAQLVLIAVRRELGDL